DTFLRELGTYSGLPPDRIILTIDGVRPQLYVNPDDPVITGSTWGLMRNYMRERATQLGMTVIDLEREFLADYRRNGRRFEYPTDSHWNGEGHRVAAEAVVATPVFRRLFPDR